MPKKRRSRSLRWYIIWFIIFFFLAASVLSLFFSLPLFRIKNIKIIGTNILSGERIRDNIDIKTGENIFFADYSKAKILLSGISQIEDYGIYRRFPNTVLVKIIERTPAVVLISRNETIIIDLHGNILKVSGGPPRTKYEKWVLIENISERPVVRGFTKEMIGAASILPGETSKMILDSIGSLEKFLDPSILQLELKGEDKITLLVQDILTVRLGDQKKIKDKIVVLKSILSTIQDKWDKIKYVDIRYPENPVIVYK